MDAEDERWMREAIRVATSRGSDPADTPIGAVIVRDGAVIAEARNECDTLHDPTAHAEMVAFRRAGAKVAGADNPAGEMRGATLYSTLQPCGMCTMASIWAKVGRVVYGAGRDDVHRMYFEARHTDTIAFIADSYRDDVSIEGGVMRQECAALYYRPGDAVDEDDQGNL